MCFNPREDCFASSIVFSGVVGNWGGGRVGGDRERSTSRRRCARLHGCGSTVIGLLALP